MSGSIELRQGDCIDVMRELDASSVDAVVTDPPYGLEFMGKEWDAFTPRAFQSWSERWGSEAFRVLKPGGHAVVFGGTRTYHRMVCGLEDAGFEIRDQLAWMFGSGFPKSLDVSKAIDKRPGVQSHAEFVAHLVERREALGLSRADVSERVVGTRSGACWNWEHHQFPEARWWPALRELLDLDPAWGEVVAEAEREKTGERNGNLLAVAPGQGSDRSRTTLDVTDAATEDARRWQGWGTALKPGYEPVVLARKPLSGTVAANVLAHGVGALNVDGCRIEHSDPPITRIDFSSPTGDLFSRGGGENAGPNAAGRWPANVVLDSDVAAMLDEQSGEVGGGFGIRGSGPLDGRTSYAMPGQGQEVGYGDSGGASRFFKTVEPDSVSPPCEVVATAEPSSSPDTTEAGTALSGAATSDSHEGKRKSGSKGRSTSAMPKTSSGSGETGTPMTVSTEDASSHESSQGEPTQTPSPANDVQQSEPTGTMTTTPSQQTYDGSAAGATLEDTSRSTDHGEKVWQPDLDGVRFAYCAKVSRAERNAGLDQFEERLASKMSGGEFVNPQRGTVSTETRMRNVHPTVKPVALMRWLCRLVTPPGGLILDPFLGSGSTGIAASLEGFRFIGVEREREYMDIARARIAFWEQHGDGALDIVRTREAADRVRGEIADAGQLDLLEAL